MRFSVKKSVVLCAAVFAASGLTGCNSDSNDKSSNDSDIVILDELYAGKDPSTVDDDAVTGKTYTYDGTDLFFEVLTHLDMDKLNFNLNQLNDHRQLPTNAAYELNSPQLRTGLNIRVRCGNGPITHATQAFQSNGQEYIFTDSIIQVTNPDGTTGYNTVQTPTYKAANAQWRSGYPEEITNKQWSYAPAIPAIPQAKQALYEETMDHAFTTFKAINDDNAYERTQDVVDKLSGGIDEKVSEFDALFMGYETDVDVMFGLKGLQKIEHPVGYDDVQHITIGSKIGVFELRGWHNTCEYSVAIASGSTYAADIIYKTAVIQGSYVPEDEDEMTDDMY
ncbi:hypothetical protein [Vibrio rumoiensis]|uniref:hypothetical protein n=1 Tax=Vibrio rumoiensis TaxID=76258 RepID=UPI003AA974E5